MSTSSTSSRHIYLEPEEDGLLMRPVGSWTKEKLDFLQRYIDIFTKGMYKKPWRAFHYIDLFSGPGKARVSETQEVILGSPLIALRAEKPFTEYFFVDIDEKNSNALEKRCQAFIKPEHIHIYTGDANSIVYEVVDYILSVDSEFISGAWSSLNFAFVDPEGLELQWSTIEALARINKIDMLIYYPQMGITREMPKEIDQQPPTPLDRFFGDQRWRLMYKQKCTDSQRRHLASELLDYYLQKIQSLGYKAREYQEIKEHSPLIRNRERNAPLYRLIFVSKHKRGHEFWEKISQRNVYGQGRLPLSFE